MIVQTLNQRKTALRWLTLQEEYMERFTPNFNYMMAEHLNRQVALVKELHTYYKVALLTEDEETLRKLDDKIALEESFLYELYEVL